jgi:8-oxo-dGTP pyrophosphatase MutT (NUDIX family)
MEQRYKVFIADRPVFFQSAVEKTQKNLEHSFCISYSQDSDFERVYEKLQSTPEIQAVFIECPSVEAAFKAFLAMHEEVVAAGGLVENGQGKYLFIERLGFLDLPKGKLEKGESIDEAALREVEEECGITSLEIVKKLPTTYHTYFHKGRRVLKPSYWFLMRSSLEEQDLVPQTEEGITAVLWLSEEEALSREKEMYRSISDLFTRSVQEL